MENCRRGALVVTSFMHILLNGEEGGALSRNKIGAAASLHDKASWEVGRPHGPNSIFMLTWFCTIFAAGAAPSCERLTFLKRSIQQFQARSICSSTKKIAFKAVTLSNKIGREEREGQLNCFSLRSLFLWRYSERDSRKLLTIDSWRSFILCSKVLLNAHPPSARALKYC